ncbi:MAG TPA: DUF296 domain-containing protein [Polyangiaceae bacterium]|nr:DUF296 domain-containing protein [Polyangiaceae bacterium]
MRIERWTTAAAANARAVLVACALLATILSGCAKPRAAPDHTLVQVPGIRGKLVGSSPAGDRIQLVFEPGAEIVSALSSFITSNRLVAVNFDGFGACSDAKFAWYDAQRRDYKITSLNEHMEVVSLIGDAAPTDDKVGFHAHVGLGMEDGTMRGGHLLEAHVYPTLEVFLVSSPTPIHRRHDDVLNSNLLVP